jgi:hypothetical protein
MVVIYSMSTQRHLDACRPSSLSYLTSFWSWLDREITQVGLGCCCASSSTSRGLDLDLQWSLFCFNPLVLACKWGFLKGGGGCQTGVLLLLGLRLAGTGRVLSKTFHENQIRNRSTWLTYHGESSRESGHGRLFKVWAADIYCRIIIPYLRFYPFHG